MRSLSCASLLALAAYAGCGDAPVEPEPVCNAGDFVFCRCETGLEGMKQCNEDGLGFAECRLGPTRPCPTENVTTGAASGGAGGGGVGGGGGSTTASTTTTATTTTTSSTTGGGEGGAGPVGPWINELHYDNNSNDLDEGVEIAGPAGTDMTGWIVFFYNGSDGTVYGSESLGGVLPDEQNGVGAIWYAHPGLQNGSPDGLALVSPLNEVVLFLSYEGAFLAQDGPAAGMTSVDMVASELDTSPIGLSLQLTGTGSSYASFAWQPPAASSPGALNAGQTIP